MLVEKCDPLNLACNRLHCVPGLCHEPRKEVFSGQLEPRPEHGRVNRRCLNCAGTFRALARNVRVGQGRYCLDPACQLERRKETRAQHRRALPVPSAGKRRAEKDRYPERVKARKAVRAAIKAGKLTRGACHCGDPLTEGHHHRGYAKEHRLDVVWLCRAHHIEADAGHPAHTASKPRPLCWLCHKPIEGRVYYQGDSPAHPSHRGCLVRPACLPRQRRGQGEGRAA